MIYMIEPSYGLHRNFKDSGWGGARIYWSCGHPNQALIIEPAIYQCGVPCLFLQFLLAFHVKAGGGREVCKLTNASSSGYCSSSFSYF